jgi:hypothetical protein
LKFTFIGGGAAIRNMLFVEGQAYGNILPSIGFSRMESYDA